MTGSEELRPTRAPGLGCEAEADAPLCVDLDGTLVKSDTLVDSVLAMVRQRPRDLWRVPSWIVEGKAAFKQRVGAAVQLDVEHLPYNRPLLEWLREQAGGGREIYLATAADRVLAERVAAYLNGGPGGANDAPSGSNQGQSDANAGVPAGAGHPAQQLFRGVLASDGAINLAGGNKLGAFRARFGERFCYIGNARPDAAVLAACESPMVANPSRGLRAAMRRVGALPTARFDDRPPALTSWLKAVRLHQWAKNTLIFVPLLLAHAWNAAAIVGAVVAFFSFGMCASGTYILNDLVDIESDRRHPRKRNRPFAAGDLSVIAGIAAVVLLLAASLALALALPHLVEAMPGSYALDKPYKFLEWLVLYAVTTLVYSLYLKRKLLLDVFVLSGLYTVRILAGSGATGVAVSAWLAGFSVFFFLSLAFVKRCSELEGLRERGGVVSNGRGYFVADLEQLRMLGTGAAYAAVVVMTLYINNPDTNLLYHHPLRLWLVVPVLLLWLCQVWMLTSRGEMHEDPVVFAITDKRSLLLGVLMAAVVWWAL